MYDLINDYDEFNVLNKNYNIVKQIFNICCNKFKFMHIQLLKYYINYSHRLDSPTTYSSPHTDKTISYVDWGISNCALIG
jgi:hypothetical protein